MIDYQAIATNAMMEYEEERDEWLHHEAEWEAQNKIWERQEKMTMRFFFEMLKIAPGILLDIQWDFIDIFWDQWECINIFWDEF